VAEGVQFRALLAGFGAGSGGMLGIGFIDGGTISGGTAAGAVVAIGVCGFRNRIHNFGITRVGGDPSWWKLGSW